MMSAARKAEIAVKITKNKKKLVLPTAQADSPTAAGPLPVLRPLSADRHQAIQQNHGRHPQARRCAAPALPPPAPPPNNKHTLPTPRDCLDSPDCPS